MNLLSPQSKYVILRKNSGIYSENQMKLIILKSLKKQPLKIDVKEVVTNLKLHQVRNSAIIQ